MWRPTAYGEEDFAAFREAMAASPIDAVLIHAVYLLNCASEDPEIRAKSLASLTHSLRVGQAIGAAGVVLHPGSAKTGDVGAAIARAGETIGAGARRQRGLPAAPGEHGRRRRHARALASRSSPRCSRPPAATSALGVCLDSCHLLASGYDIRTRARHGRRCSRVHARGSARGGIRSLHLNDSQTPLGSNRDRHANIGEGELGEAGLRGVPLGAGAAAAAVRAGDPGREPRRRPRRGSRSWRWSCASAASPRRGADAPLQRRQRGRGRRLACSARARCSSSARSVGVCATR